MDQNKIDILQRALDRQIAARKVAEKILEEKSIQIFNASIELKQVNKKLEDLLKEKTGEFESFYENIFDAYLIMDLKGNVLKMNPIAIELFEYDLKIEDLNVVDLISKKDYGYAFNSYKELLEKGVFENFKSKIITKTGKERWVHINSSLILGKNNQAIAAHGIIRDITETKEAAKLINSQKEQLDVIVDHSLYGIALVKDNKIVRANKKLQDLLGNSNEEMNELNFTDILSDKGFKYYQKQMSKIKAREIDSFVFEHRYHKKDNVAPWLKFDLAAVRDNNGSIKYKTVFIEDVTYLREKRLITEMINNIAKNILGKNNIDEIAWEIAKNVSEFLGTKDCAIYLINHKVQTLEQIAFFDDNVINTDRFNLNIGEGIVGSVAKNGKSEIIGDTSKDNRYIIQNMIRLSEITVPIIYEGRVLAIIDSEHIDKNYFSKTQLNTLESIANLVSLQLNNAINQRERNKIEKQNMALLYELEKSNNELQEYAHVVSHDLKSPLRNINALMSWIKEDNQGKLDDSSLKNFDYIDSTLEKMEALISDILDYSKINSQAGRDDKVDLDELVQGIRENIFIPDHISISVLSNLPVISGNQVKLQQLFQNLIGNSIKFSDKKVGLIEIDVVDIKTHFHFSVKDNGIGIDKKYHSDVFKIFQTYTNIKESSGIGLSIVRKIVELYNGKIWIDSELGKGTTVNFTIKKETFGAT